MNYFATAILIYKSQDLHNYSVTNACLKPLQLKRNSCVLINENIASSELIHTNCELISANCGQINANCELISTNIELIIAKCELNNTTDCNQEQV